MCEKCRLENSRKPHASRRMVLGFAAASAIGLALGSTSNAKDAKPPPKPENVLSPDAAFERLRKGNARYVEGVSRRHDFKHEREALVGGQNPFASILSCADSRIAPEYAFDSARGDLFVCRVAGNFANEESIASLEYSIAVLKTPLILVLGHDACGAVDATIKSLKDGTTLPGRMPSLVAGLREPVLAALQQPASDTLSNAIRLNVLETVDKLKKTAPIINKAVEQQKLKVVGGIYRLRDGRVDMIAPKAGPRAAVETQGAHHVDQVSGPPSRIAAGHHGSVGRKRTEIRHGADLPA
jgi:carbonic anhydrase